MKLPTPILASRHVTPMDLHEVLLSAIRIQHPEWINAEGDCPPCREYESKLIQLLAPPPVKDALQLSS